jgi:hypothetical protein
MGVGMGFDLSPIQPLSLGLGIVKPSPMGTHCHPYIEDDDNKLFCFSGVE